MSESGIPGLAAVQLENEAPQTAARRSMVLNMGPRHPSTHGVLRLLMELDGALGLAEIHVGDTETAQRRALAIPIADLPRRRSGSLQPANELARM